MLRARIIAMCAAEGSITQVWGDCDSVAERWIRGRESLYGDIGCIRDCQKVDPT